MKPDTANPDLFRFKQFDMINGSVGLKVGTDGVLLGAWALPPAKATVWDVGAGTGVIALMIAQRHVGLIEGFEIDAVAANVCAENFRRSPWSDRLLLIEGDVTSVAQKAIAPDFIVSNPPYFGAGDSLMAKERNRDTARRASTLDYGSLFRLGSQYLSDSGELALISPYNAAGEIEQEAMMNRMSLMRRTVVVTKEGKKPSRILWQFSKRSRSISQDDVLIMRDSAGNYSDEYKQLTKDYYLDF